MGGSVLVDTAGSLVMESVTITDPSYAAAWGMGMGTGIVVFTCPDAVLDDVTVEGASARLAPAIADVMDLSAIDNVVEATVGQLYATPDSDALAFGSLGSFGSSLSFSEVTVKGCATDFAGGLALVGVSATFADVKLEDNEASYYGGGTFDGSLVTTTGPGIGLEVIGNRAFHNVGGLGLSALQPGSSLNGTELSDHASPDVAAIHCINTNVSVFGGSQFDNGGLVGVYCSACILDGATPANGLQCGSNVTGVVPTTTSTTTTTTTTTRAPGAPVILPNIVSVEPPLSPLRMGSIDLRSWDHPQGGCSLTSHTSTRITLISTTLCSPQSVG